MIDLLHGDCLELMKGIPDGSVDAIISDPPYGLEFMGKAWDKGVPGVEFWVEMIRILKPGGHLLSFSGTRTYHRMATAIEDAGFEIRDMIEWIYGSGFPKSLNIGKVVDKLQGNKREEISRGGNCGVFAHSGSGTEQNIDDYESVVTKGTSEWEGWGTALKPAHEPICMARKPITEKTVAENVLKYGTGGINIDDSRITAGSEITDRISKGGNKNKSNAMAYLGKIIYAGNILGRFPANIIHDNSEEVRECFPESKSTSSVWKGFSGEGSNEGWKRESHIQEIAGGYDDTGNASRFFKSIIYQSKASKKERGDGNTHPTVKPVALMEYLINMVSQKGGVILDPFMGSGTTGLACKSLERDFIGIEKDPGYFEISKKRIEEHSPQLTMI